MYRVNGRSISSMGWKCILAASCLAVLLPFLPRPFVQEPVRAAPMDVVRCSTNSAGGQAAGSSGLPSLSADGRYVAFVSAASDLVPGDSNGKADIFRKDLQSGEIVRCSTTSAGGQVSGDSSYPYINADGRYVAFTSLASDVVPDDTNGKADVFRKDLLSGETIRCSTSSTGSQVNGNSMALFISLDGRYVVFDSDAPDLVPGDSNGVMDVFRKDLLTGQTLRVSTTSTGAQVSGASHSGFISPNGRYVVFDSDAPDLVPGDTNGKSDIFRKDLQGGTVVRCSTKAGGGEANGGSQGSSLSWDGRYVVFESFASDLVLNDTNGYTDIFRKDLQTGEIVRCSTTDTGVEGNKGSYRPSMSWDGRYVFFESDSTDLVTGDLNNKYDVFGKDLQTGGIGRASTTAADGEANGDSKNCCMSPSAMFVAFDSTAPDLIPADSNGVMDVFRKEVPVPVPVIASISPASGMLRTQVTINGTGFRPAQSGSYVSFGDIRATKYASWTDTEIKVSVPGGVGGDVPVTVNVGGATSNAANFTATAAWLLAEGATDGGFETWVLVQNPGPSDVNVELLYQTGKGQVQGPKDRIPAKSRRSYLVNSTVTTFDVSTLVLATGGEVICERAVYWKPGPSSPRVLGHDSIGVIDASPRWFLAEGATAGGFETWVLVQNPNPDTVHVDFTLNTGEGEKKPAELQDVEIPGNSRRSFDIGRYVKTYDVSTMVVARDGEVICERAMYWTPAGSAVRTLGHDSVGVVYPSDTWFLAEGATAGGFETWVLVQNPTTDTVHVDFTLNTDAGEKKPAELQGVEIPPATRRSFNLGKYVTSYDVSTKVAVRDGGVICERAMYWTPVGSDVRELGHNSIGVTLPSRGWYLPEGATAGGFETWVLVQNPGGNPVHVDFTLNTDEGEKKPAELQDVEIPGGSRRSFNIGKYVTTYNVSTQVSAEDGDIICERAVYWRASATSPWVLGHDSIGYPE